jgi:hypothetical protein
VSSTEASEAVRAQITDVVFELKASVEDQDLDSLRAMFTPRAQFCVRGHFMTAKEFFAALEQIPSKVEQVSMDIARIEEIEESETSAFISVDVDLSWIDAVRWEEDTAHGLLALTLVRVPPARPKERGKSVSRIAELSAQLWRISGLSFFDGPRRDEEPEPSVPIDVTTGIGPSGFGSRLFGSPYDIISIWL